MGKVRVLRFYEQPKSTRKTNAIETELISELIDDIRTNVKHLNH